jgi:glycosyltransferase involved in cell wall biosynthesis
MLSSSVPARIACCSRNAVPLHKKIGYHIDKITVIPNGYAVDHIRPCTDSRCQVRRRLGIDNAKPVLGMVARFDPHKDHANLLRALAILTQQGRDYTCLLVGDRMAPDNEALMAMIRQAAIEGNVRLLGPRRDIPAIMNALDVHVLSSMGEAFPNVLAEALACGTPCITTDVGDAALIVGDTGWVIPARDSRALAAAINHALDERRDSPSAWQSRQVESRRRILDNFSLEKMVAAYRALWLDTLETIY